MGTAQSVQVDEDEEEEEEEEGEDDVHGGENNRRELGNLLVKKVLEQEPEMLPCHSSTSPLSPQLSSLGTPRLGPSIKVWDPYNVLAPPPPPPPPPPPEFPRSCSMDGLSGSDDRRTASVTEVFLINHGECEMSLRPELVSGRCPRTALTPAGKRQARALAVFLNSQGVRFAAVYSSPLARARETAASVCLEMAFAEEQIQSSDALVEMSQGHWEGCLRSEIYTPEILNFIDRLQPDFSAPSGESIRQVEFRMVQFLNGTVLGPPDKLMSDLSSIHQNESHSLHALVNSGHDRDGPLQSPRWDLFHKPRQGPSRKKSGKSRLQFVTTTGHQEAEDEVSPQETNYLEPLHGTSVRSSTSGVTSIGVFTHSVPIKCLITGLLGCNPMMSQKICLEESSVTVLQHAWNTGWQLKRLNDTAHLRLL